MSRTPAILLAVVALALPAVASAKDGAGEARVAGACSQGASAELRLKRDDGAIELRFALRHGRAGSWRVAIVQERRVVWKRTGRQSGSFELRRTLRDLAGANAITATAWGPQGLVCRASATLASSSGGGDSD
jgi:hypothetical protein